MSTPPREIARAAAALAYVCEHLADIRSTLGDNSASLRRLLETAQTAPPQDLGVAVAAVHHDLRAAGDTRGLFGHLRGIEPLGLRSFHIIYRCPLARCTGRDGNQVNEHLPHCTLSGQPLERERLA
jgi:hypothetical protein